MRLLIVAASVYARTSLGSISIRCGATGNGHMWRSTSHINQSHQTCLAIFWLIKLLQSIIVCAGETIETFYSERLNSTAVSKVCGLDTQTYVSYRPNYTYSLMTKRNPLSTRRRRNGRNWKKKRNNTPRHAFNAVTHHSVSSLIFSARRANWLMTGHIFIHHTHRKSYPYEHELWLAADCWPKRYIIRISNARTREKCVNICEIDILIEQK